MCIKKNPLLNMEFTAKTFYIENDKYKKLQIIYPSKDSVIQKGSYIYYTESGRNQSTSPVGNIFLSETTPLNLAKPTANLNISFVNMRFVRDPTTGRNIIEPPSRYVIQLLIDPEHELFSFYTPDGTNDSYILEPRYNEQRNAMRYYLNGVSSLRPFQEWHGEHYYIDADGTYTLPDVFTPINKTKANVNYLINELEKLQSQSASLLNQLKATLEM